MSATRSGPKLILVNSTHATIILLLCVAAAIVLLPGCAVNGRPMRFPPEGEKPSLSWRIEGQASNNVPISCSFVEFDERGDFLDFRQHTDCEHTISNLVHSGQKVLLVMYCHGWKNNSQSGNVVSFNGFLAKLAASPDIVAQHVRVHGVYLAWRGNPVLPYIDRTDPEVPYAATEKMFGGPIVADQYQRSANWTEFIPENLSVFSRRRAADHLVSGLPIARAIFTYASAAKNYGGNLDNQVVVMGHSFGALLLERGLGQALTGSLVMEWWRGLDQAKSSPLPSLPFDLILFVNSAAPSIYAKEMRDFLEAHRSAMHKRPGQDAPVIVSVTSTADWATGEVEPLINIFAPLQPSLRRKYTTGIFGTPTDGVWPTHRAVPQWKFYRQTPGHQPLLLNHWIEKDASPLPPDTSPDAIFARNITQPTNGEDPDVFFTSANGQYKAAAWKIAKAAPKGQEVTMDGLPLAMTNSDYWIVSCGGELIASHDDIWTTTTMEMYAGIYRAARSRFLHAPTSEAGQRAR